METKKFGLIGRNISYSFSKKYFEEKFKTKKLEGYSYDLFDIPEIENIDAIFKTENLKGLNVTIPYKEKVIPFLDELSDEAQNIGAVNTIKIDQNGKKTGYNTDTYGFEKTLLIHKKDYHTSAIIIGDGGAAKAVKYVFDKNNIPYIIVSRKSEINFNNITSEIVKNHKIVVQCTPVGTFPKVEDCVEFPFDGITDQHLIIDLIYNPEYTQFIKNSAKMGAKTVNGYYMLEQQAEKAWEIWNY